MKLLISDVTLIDGASDRAEANRSILIDGGRIRDIAPAGLLESQADVEIVDGRGKYAIPGFINADVHLMGDIRLEHLVRHETCFDDLITEAAQIALKGGVTSLFDTWGPLESLARVRDGINSGATPGSRIYCCGNILGVDGPLSEDFFPDAARVASPTLMRTMNARWSQGVGPELCWQTRDTVVQRVKAYIEKGVDFIKFAGNDHRGLGAQLFSSRVQDAIISEAHRAGLKALAFAITPEAIQSTVAAGCDISSSVSGAVALPEETLRLITDRKVAVRTYPVTRRRLAWLAKRSGGQPSPTYAVREANIQNLIEMGATLIMATDGALVAQQAYEDPVFASILASDPEDGRASELGAGHFHWLQAMEELGYPPMKILKAATSDVARSYGVDTDLGTLEPGKFADILLLNANPIEGAQNYKSIDRIIKEGALVNTAQLPNAPILSAGG